MTGTRREWKVTITEITNRMIGMRISPIIIIIIRNSNNRRSIVDVGLNESSKQVRDQEKNRHLDEGNLEEERIDPNTSRYIGEYLVGVGPESLNFIISRQLIDS